MEPDDRLHHMDKEIALLKQRFEVVELKLTELSKNINFWLKAIFGVLLMSGVQAFAEFALNGGLNIVK